MSKYLIKPVTMLHLSQDSHTINGKNLWNQIDAWPSCLPYKVAKPWLSHLNAHSQSTNAGTRRPLTVNSNGRHTILSWQVFARRWHSENRAKKAISAEKEFAHRACLGTFSSSSKWNLWEIAIRSLVSSWIEKYCRDNFLRSVTMSTCTVVRLRLRGHWHYGPPAIGHHHCKWSNF